MCARLDSQHSTASSSSGSSDSLFQDYEQLNNHERWWMERADFLESRGYRLRPRFRPGWVPSWQKSGQNPFDFEDSRYHLTEGVMDATRLSDGRRVALKAVRRYDNEVKIAMMLSSPEALNDPMNHCVPILDFFTDLSTRGPDFIVMPHLRAFNLPEFCTISEVLDFVQQTLEGLLYMHRRRVAHRSCRDLTGANIMMDARDLFPDGVHPDPLWSALLHDRFDVARSLRRIDVKTVKYYFIDFGISSYFDDPLEPRQVTGIDGRDQEVPELDLKKPYDPFAVDVYTLGNTYRELFRQKYNNLDFLSPLVEQMTERSPESRPTAEDALALFRKLSDQPGGASAHRRLRPVKEPIIVHYICELSSSLGAFLQTLQRAFSEFSSSAFLYSADSEILFTSAPKHFICLDSSWIICDIAVSGQP
ncbi:hypothetical protein ACEPAI_4314 [Sanghuangporus weigelae]